MDDVVEVMARGIDPLAFSEHTDYGTFQKKCQTDALKAARAALSALSEAGWVVVPKDFHRLPIEPKDIRLPYPNVYGEHDDYEKMELTREIFELVLSAAPAPK